MCPDCNGRLKAHSCYSRHFRDENGKRYYGWVAQVHCADCDTYPALIPDFLMPHKHYEASVIEAEIARAEGTGSPGLSSCQANESTVLRWVRQFKERGACAVGWLTSILLDVYERHISAVKTRNKGLLDQLRRLAREFQVPADGSVIGNVNIILTRYNHGFL